CKSNKRRSLKLYKIIILGVFCLVCSLSVQAMEPEELLTKVSLLTFDSTKNRFVSDNVNNLNRDLTFKELITLVEYFDFDSSKVKAVKTLRGHHEEYSDLELSELMEVIDFDSTKEKLLKVLDAEAAEFSETTSSKSSSTSVTSTKSTTLTIRCDGFDCETEYVSK
ncbi:DUF4476 domain-containing protein, partial [Vibrio parahaemolyticus]